MNNERIKQELHDLIDNLNVDAALIDHSYRLYQNGDKTQSKYSTIQWVAKLLSLHPKPKEKTLEQKLVDAGFTKVFKNDDNKYHRADGSGAFIVIEPHNNIVRVSCLYNVLSYNKLQSNIHNHDQIFADIEYLESKEKAEHE